MEDFRPVQADAQRAVAQCGVLLMGQVEVVDLLVRADSPMHRQACFECRFLSQSA
jgi:hypothetical protein